MGVSVILIPATFFASTTHVLKGPRVNIVMTVDTEQLPITAVGRVVIVIVVPVMDRELLEFFAGKLPAADAADPRKQFKGPLSIGFITPFPITQGFVRNSFFLPALVLHIFLQPPQ